MDLSGIERGYGECAGRGSLRFRDHCLLTPVVFAIQYPAADLPLLVGCVYLLYRLRRRRLRNR